MTPKCRECMSCKPYRFVTIYRVQAQCGMTNGKVIASGGSWGDAVEALPATSPRWCPRRTANKKKEG